MSATSPLKRDAYRFGDTDLAAERLRLLAEVFAPGIREFLNSLRPTGPRNIADLGCGPGHTTRLLAEVFPQATVIGIDSSDRFIELAKQIVAGRTSYRVANATEPLAGGPYDLIYSRYLLTHLAQPLAAIQLWEKGLRPSGLIAIEENDWIQTGEPAFAKYVAIVTAMLAAGRQRLFVGAELAASEYGPALAIRSSDLVSIAVASDDAARMFLMNLESWREQPFVQENYTQNEINTLAQDLKGLIEQNSPVAAITFGRRRLVLKKTS